MRMDSKRDIIIIDMDKLELYSEAIDHFVSIIKNVRELRNDKVRHGKNINVFTLWNNFSGLSEPIHSKILHFFLSDNPMHGQGYLFLGLFLKRIGISIQDKDEWVVTAETGRVDVMLKRFYPRSIVIIENKSNWAGDQPNQLYRYWYQNIHLSEEDCKPEYYVNHPEYQIVYLVPNKDKLLSDNSMERPSDYPKTLPEILPITPHIFSFEEEVSEWLTECISVLPDENTPLINLITQYKDYCKNL